MSASVTGRMEHLDAVTKRVSQQNMARIARLIAAKGVSAAREAYSAATLLPGDTMPSVVMAEWDGSSLYVQVEGGGAFFIEFGTGVHQDGTEVGHKHGFTPASWSEVNAHWLTGKRLEAFKGWWPIPGEHAWTMGQQPADAVGAAEQAMREAVADSVKQILSGG
jgi:hypothetical protein